MIDLKIAAWSCVLLLALAAVNGENLTAMDLSQKVQKLEANITGLREAGIRTAMLDDMLASIKADLSREDLPRAQSMYSQAILTANRMASISKLIDDTEILILEASRKGLNISLANYHLSLGIGEYDRNNLEAAEQQAAQAKALALEALKESVQGLEEELQALEPLASKLNQDIINRSMKEASAYTARNDFASLAMLSLSIEPINKSLHQLEQITQVRDRLSSSQPTQRLADLIKELETSLDRMEFGKVESAYNSSISIINLSQATFEGQQFLKAKYNDPAYAGIDLTQSQDLLSTSELEYDYENYEKSAEYLKMAQENLDEIEKEHVMQAMYNRARERFDLIKYLRKNWLWLTLASLVIYASAKLYSIIHKLEKHRKIQASLSKESEALGKLIFELQEEYYVAKTIDKETYTTQKNNYEQRMAQITKELPVLKSQVAKEEALVARFQNKFHHTSSKKK